MSELISWMIRYMENDRFSKWQKLSRLLWVLFVAFAIDNAFGLSSIVYNSFKLDSFPEVSTGVVFIVGKDVNVSCSF